MTQLNLHDGRNIIVDDAAKYSTNDSLIISLPSRKLRSTSNSEKEHVAT